MGIILYHLRARTWKEEIRELNEQIEKTKSIETKIKKQIKSLNALLKGSQTNTDNLRDRLKASDQNIHHLNTQIKERKKTIFQKNAELQTRVSMIQQLTTQLEEAKERGSEQESLLLEKEHVIGNLEARMGAMQDDFTVIAGIGPKVSAILRDSKIDTFTKLSALNVERINEVLEKANPNLLRLVDSTTWPEQAKLAAEGDWGALSSLQDDLRVR